MRASRMASKFVFAINSLIVKRGLVLTGSLMIFLSTRVIGLSVSDMAVFNKMW